MKALRRLPTSDRKILYLTFDDGPQPGSTEPVLDLLARLGVRATFFVIAEKAQAEPHLFRRIRAEGHLIGNHSLDHGYSRFFRGQRALRDWIAHAERVLRELQGGEPTVGFRPPAGVRTPELYAALTDLGMPLILWNTRFFDTRFRWTPARARRSLGRAGSGDIILLHDAQSERERAGFISTLEIYIGAARAAGFEFGVIRGFDF